MGTRNLTMVKHNGKIKVAQYGQWDGYPTGQGKIIADFLRYGLTVDRLRDNLKNVSFYKNDKELDKVINSIENLLGENANISLRMPEINRDTGANILDIISKINGKLKLVNSRSFLKDGLFCEYAYLINLDTNKVTLYTNGKKYKDYTFEVFSSDGMMQKIENELNNEDNEDTL